MAGIKPMAGVKRLNYFPRKESTPGPTHDFACLRLVKMMHNTKSGSDTSLRDHTLSRIQHHSSTVHIKATVLRVGPLTRFVTPETQVGLGVGTLAPLACGALSVPRKNRALPLVAAASTAARCSSRFSIGRQNACGRRPPCHTSPCSPWLVLMRSMWQPSCLSKSVRQSWSHRQ